MTERKNVNPNFEVKPLRFYQENEKSISMPKEGDMVIARVISYSHGTVTLKVNGLDAEMGIADTNLFHTYEKNEKNMISLIGKNVNARVKKVIDSNFLLLERESIMRETYDALKSKVGEIVVATVEGVLEYAMFIDIGNGVNSMLHVSEVSQARYYDLTRIFHSGEELKVKILGFDPETGFFSVSRKDTYQKVTFEVGTCIKVRCAGYLHDKTGVYVEFNPQTLGIMDVPENMCYFEFLDGDEVVVSIKGENDKGFKANFFSFAD